MQNQSCLSLVVARLNELGVAASLEYPGFISIPVDPDLAWHFGDANPRWGGELINEVTGQSLYVESFPNLPSSCQDIDAIATTLKTRVATTIL